MSFPIDSVLDEPEALAIRFPDARVSVTLGSVELIESPAKTTGADDLDEVSKRAIPFGNTAKTLATTGKFNLVGDCTAASFDTEGIFTM